MYRSEATLGLLCTEAVSFLQGSGLFSHGFSLEFEMMSVVDEPVEDCIGECRIGHRLMPVISWKLAGDDGGAMLMPVVEKFEEVALMGGGELCQPPVVEHDHVDASRLFEELEIATIAVGDLQIFEETGEAMVLGSIPFEAGCVRQGSGDKAFAQTGGAGDDDVLMTAHPVGEAKGKHEFFVKSARASIIDVDHRGGLFQVCCLQATRETTSGPFGALAVDQQSEAFVEAEALDVGQVQLFGECPGHAGEGKLVEAIDGGMVQHGLSPGVWV